MPKIQRAQHRLVTIETRSKGTYALISESTTADTAVVFVHGFKGDPQLTWENFQTMMDSQSHASPRWQEFDAFFFSYNDHSDSIDDSAQYLMDFVAGLYPSFTVSDPEIGIFSREYTTLILVGHSEGAVVIRTAVVYAGKKSSSDVRKAPILNATVVLFAPAHFGFVPNDWPGVVAALTGFGRLIKMIVAKSTPATEMHDKTFLHQIRNTLEYLYARSPDVPAYSAHVLFGTDEHIVVRQYYIQDCRHIPEKGRDHSNVCKPDFGYTRPFTFVQGDDC